MNSVQKNVEGLIPSIQNLSLEAIQLSWVIASLESELSNLPEVIRINKEILEKRTKLREIQKNELELREQGKEIMMTNNLKEFTTLDGTVVSIQFTPWALVVEEWAEVPDEFYKVKTTRDLDKTSLKKAITQWEFYSDKVYIQKECKLNIKNK